MNNIFIKRCIPITFPFFLGVHDRIYLFTDFAAKQNKRIAYIVKVGLHKSVLV